jgi:hypothetical protein
MTSDFDLHAKPRRAALDHPPRVNPIHRFLGQFACAADGGTEQGGFGRVTQAGHLYIGVEIGFQVVVRGHLVPLAAFLVQADPPALAGTAASSGVMRLRPSAGTDRWPAEIAVQSNSREYHYKRRRAGQGPRGSAADLLTLWRRLPGEGLSGPWGGHAFWPGHGTASPLSLCRMWRQRSWYRLAIALPVDTGTQSASGASLRPHDLQNGG